MTVLDYSPPAAGRLYPARGRCTSRDARRTPERRLPSPRRELGPSPLCCCYTPLGEGRGDPPRFRLAPRRVSLLAASRAVRNPLPPSCVLEGTHVILTRSLLMRRFGTNDG